MKEQGTTVGKSKRQERKKEKKSSMRLSIAFAVLPGTMNLSCSLHVREKSSRKRSDRHQMITLPLSSTLSFLSVHDCIARDLNVYLCEIYQCHLLADVVLVCVCHSRLFFFVLYSRKHPVNMFYVVRLSSSFTPTNALTMPGIEL